METTNVPTYSRMRRTAVRLALMLGLATVALGALLTVAALAASGDPDPTFDGDGKVTTDFGGYDGGSAVAIQSDSKIVVAGYASNDFALARYNDDGSLDTTFGTSGITTTNFGGSDGGSSVAIQSDGMIVVAGYANNDFALARYNDDGSLDTTFGTSGITTTHFGYGSDNGRAVAIQSDGMIVVAGYADNGSDDDFALARYNTDGSLDTAFGTGGITTTHLSGNDDKGYAIVIQSDGKIIVAGGSGSNFTLARYNTDGSLDTDFGTDGATTTHFGSASAGSGVALQSDGKIIVAGYTSGVGGSDLALARYDTDGNLDTTFGMSGTTASDVDNGSDYINAIAIQDDDKIVATGFATVDGSYDLIVARYDAQGNLDTNFGTGGIVLTYFSGMDFGNGIAIQTDHKIVAVGQVGGDFGVVRYDVFFDTYLPLVVRSYP